MQVYNNINYYILKFKIKKLDILKIEWDALFDVFDDYFHDDDLYYDKICFLVQLVFEKSSFNKNNTITLSNFIHEINNVLYDVFYQDEIDIFIKKIRNKCSYGKILRLEK